MRIIEKEKEKNTMENQTTTRNEKGGNNMKLKKCCICGKKFEEWGNNPCPIREKGECCDKCNMEIVIPTRILLYKG